MATTDTPTTKLIPHGQGLALLLDPELLREIGVQADTPVNVTTDGRKLAIDARMLSATAPDYAGSKVNALVENVARLWIKTAAARGTQMVFCDMGVHPTPWGYSAYGDMIEKLIARGIPRTPPAA